MLQMGMTYEELSTFGIARKVLKLGPYGMFSHLTTQWRDKYPLEEIATKVKRFFHYYAINRHKMTILTPSYHAEAYSPDDNRFDLRPFLLPPQYQSWPFKKIDDLVARIQARKRTQAQEEE